MKHSLVILKTFLQLTFFVQELINKQKHTLKNSQNGVYVMN